MKLEIEKITQINFEMAGGCNLKCPMCPQSTGREEDFLKKFSFGLVSKGY
jgi:MoaA/NifB/PqqE/SkfB family radical SAM enzyme